MNAATNGTGTERLPAALAEPVREVRAGWIGLLFLANLGLWLAFYAPIQVLLPEQSAALDPSGKALTLSLVMGIGAAVALVANPLIGTLSDRTTARWGRRHPWTLAGALFGAAGLGVLAIAPNTVVMILGWCLVQAGLNGMLATLTAALADRVPREQRGRLGGLTGISQMLGTVIGALVVTVLVTGLAPGYAACALLVVVGACAFTLCTPDDQLPKRFRPGQSLFATLRGMWISPRAHPDFGWGWVMHFLINLGNAIGTLYLLYFLSDAVHYRDPQTGLLILMALYGAALAIGAVVCGMASDRSGRRKPFVLGSAVVMAIAAILLVCSPSWTASLAAAPLLGVGFGTYWAAAPAVLTQILPAASDRAKDLGLINIANSLPQVVAPVIAAAVLGTVHSYPVLFALSALVTLAGGAVVLAVRAVR
ncbi:MFS transporter [Sciscionella marina]|uniref:MFS transporter n=1 Tax=Sciscionella marina TaxID=508770 RepID=UPI00036690B4|nr:MFS transporter [Sciscionella marina]